MTPRIAFAQMTATEDVQENLRVCARLVAEAKARGATMVALPENCAYLGPVAQKVELAERFEDDATGEIFSALRELAREHEVHLVAGGVAEISPDPERAYNTCLLFAPDGGLAAKYRKIHLFDVNLAVSGGRGLQESESVLAGDEPVCVDLEWGRIGLTVCYDLRFPELYRELARQGAVLMLVPAAFTLQTGKDHWEVLLRARAIENLCYVIAPAQVGRHSDKRSSWGKAMAVDPWGVVQANLGDRVGVAVVDLDLDYLARVRQALPALDHRRLE